MTTVKDLLDAPMDTVEPAVMIEDLKQFLDLAESNFESLYEKELHKIERTREAEGFEYPEEAEQLEWSANRRFKVYLPLLARYGALVSLVTSVEWSVKRLNSLLRPEFQEDGSPAKGNDTVNALRRLDSLTGIGKSDAVSEFEALVHVRNCIAHNAGIVTAYKYEAELPKSVALLAGFSIRDSEMFGDQLWIDRQALDHHIDRMDTLIFILFRECHKQGYMRRAEIRIPTASPILDSET